MRTSLFTLIISAVVAMLALGGLAVLAYDWCYGLTTFGGHLGFAMVMAIGLCLFVLGTVFNGAMSNLLFYSDAELERTDPVGV